MIPILLSPIKKRRLSLSLSKKAKALAEKGFKFNISDSESSIV